MGSFATNLTYDAAGASAHWMPYEDTDEHPVLVDLARLARDSHHFAQRSKRPPPRILAATHSVESSQKLDSRRWAAEFPGLPEPRRRALEELPERQLDSDSALYVDYILRELWLLSDTLEGQLPSLIKHLFCSINNPNNLASFILELSALHLIATHPACEGCAVQVKHTFNGGKMEIDVAAKMRGEVVLAEVTTGTKRVHSRQMQRLFDLTGELDRDTRARLYCVFGIFGATHPTRAWQSVTSRAVGPLTLAQLHDRLVADWGPYGIIGRPVLPNLQKLGSAAGPHSISLRTPVATLVRTSNKTVSNTTNRGNLSLSRSSLVK